jgi:hypothetical protein
MLLNFSIFNTIFNDVAQPWQLGFQDSALRWGTLLIFAFLLIAIILAFHTICGNNLIFFYFFTNYNGVLALVMVSWLDLSADSILSFTDCTYVPFFELFHYFFTVNFLEYTSQLSMSILPCGKIYGSALGSSRLTKIARDMYKLSPFHESILVGLLLSDA